MLASFSEILIVPFWELHLSSSIELLVHLLDVIVVDKDFGGLEDWGLNKSQVGISKLDRLEFKFEYLLHESSQKPDEGLLELVVAFG
jgi:hypothetical protein